MAALLQRAFGVLLLFLCAFGNCWVSPRDALPARTLLYFPEWMKEKSLLARGQVDNCLPLVSDPDTPQCRPICIPSNYYCSNQDIAKRSYSPWASPVLRTKRTKLVANRTTIDIETHRLSKRVWTQVLQQDVPTYVPNQFGDDYDTHFGEPDPPLFEYEEGQTEPTQTTVTSQQIFSTTPFQVGSGGLHGCTMVTIVSRRAVHIGHYWEGLGWMGNQQTYQSTILNFFSTTGQAVGNGPKVNPNLFNQAGDDTRVYIMHPRKDRDPTAFTLGQYRKISQLISTIRTLLGQNVPIATWYYVALETDDPAQNNLLETTERGHALFQYDPNALGANDLGWRLFYEHVPFFSNQPAPGPGQVNGIQPPPGGTPNPEE